MRWPDAGLSENEAKRRLTTASRTNKQQVVGDTTKWIDPIARRRLNPLQFVGFTKKNRDLAVPNPTREGTEDEQAYRCIDRRRVRRRRLRPDAPARSGSGRRARGARQERDEEGRNEEGRDGAGRRHHVEGRRRQDGCRKEGRRQEGQG